MVLVCRVPGPVHGHMLAHEPWYVERVTASSGHTKNTHQITVGAYVSLQGLELRAHVTKSQHG